MPSFLDRLGATLRQAAAGTRRPLRITVVGGGAGGIEIALTLASFVRCVLGGGVPSETTLVAGVNGLEPGRLPSTTRRVQRALARKGIEVVGGHRVVRIGRRHLVLDDAREIDTDLVVWVTGAAAPAWLATLGLPTDARGFLLTDACLRTTARAPVFVVGDSGTIAGSPAPKAGVYAVRHGPILWQNLQRVLAGTPLQPYVPQSGFLRLLNTGDGRAIGEWKRWSFEGRWCWRLKDRIDRRFAARYQVR
jgi:selenide,water dikinase